MKMAKNAVRTGRSTTLEPMNPYDRRIIHAAVAGVEGAASTSIGEEPNRRVVISSLNPRKPQQDRRADMAAEAVGADAAATAAGTAVRLRIPR